MSIDIILYHIGCNIEGVIWSVNPSAWHYVCMLQVILDPYMGAPCILAQYFPIIEWFAHRQSWMSGRTAQEGVLEQEISYTYMLLYNE